MLEVICVVAALSVSRASVVFSTEYVTLDNVAAYVQVVQNVSVMQLETVIYYVRCCSAVDLVGNFVQCCRHVVHVWEIVLVV